MAWLASVFSSNTAQHYYADRVYAVSVLKRRRVRLSVCPRGSARGTGKVRRSSKAVRRRAMRIVGCICDTQAA